GPNELLALAAVPQRLARGVDAAGQGRFRDDAAAPHGGNEIVLCDNPVAVFHQANQQVEHLRLDGDGLGTPAQLSPVGVKRMIRKRKSHFAVPPDPSSSRPDFALKKRRNCAWLSYTRRRTGG